MSRLPRPVVPPPFIPYPPPPPVQQPLIVVDSSPAPRHAAGSLSFFHLAAGVLCLCAAGVLGVGLYYAWSVHAALSSWSDELRATEAEYLPQARLLAAAALKPHGVARIASDCMIHEAAGVVTLAGACEGTDQKVRRFGCRWNVAKFGNERRWSLDYAELDGLAVSP